MADNGLDVVAGFPTNIQTYATLVASLLLGIITVYGYYKKVASEIPEHTPIYSEQNITEMISWLSKIFSEITMTSNNTKVICELLLQNQRQNEIDRAYAKGRDEALVRATNNVAHEVQKST